MDSEEDTVCRRGNVSCKTAVSKVTLRPTPRDDRARFACEAEHPAIGAAQMRVAVVLSVQCECKERKLHFRETTYLAHFCLHALRNTCCYKKACPRLQN